MFEEVELMNWLMTGVGCPVNDDLCRIDELMNWLIRHRGQVTDEVESGNWLIV
jgi:hypothetical protein